MTRFAERFIEEGIGQGEARVLLRQLTLKFGPLPEPVRANIESADADTRPAAARTNDFAFLRGVAPSSRGSPRLLLRPAGSTRRVLTGLVGHQE